MTSYDDNLYLVTGGGPTNFLCVLPEVYSINFDARVINHVLFILLRLKAYAAISNAHLSRVLKQVKLSGSCLSTINGFGST